MPKQIDINLSYSFGAKKNLGNYESADFHLSRSERWDVSDLDDEEVSKFYAERVEHVQEEIMTVANKEWEALG